jgi:hypothetical protein
MSSLFIRVGSDKLMKEFIESWKKQVLNEGVRMLNDEELASKGFNSIEDFIKFKN